MIRPRTINTGKRLPNNRRTSSQFQFKGPSLPPYLPTSLPPQPKTTQSAPIQERNRHSCRHRPGHQTLYIILYPTPLIPSPYSIHTIPYHTTPPIPSNPSIPYHPFSPYTRTPFQNIPAYRNDRLSEAKSHHVAVGSPRPHAAS